MPFAIKTSLLWQNKFTKGSPDAYEKQVIVCVWLTTWTENVLIASALSSNKRLFAFCRALRSPSASYADRKFNGLLDVGKDVADPVYLSL
jgi:hypothetical protein